ncbi:RING FINGER PROTEIN-RELATED [Salix viminalis]|uniref:E3 ubiquitin protein ligase n=1 Tax=Salix viminalis TaxID=40686 RepID=A0A9Q0NTD3_SALVM|nr:RING FINGER PROTEIN-RELATED [Salix viminalis]
MGSTGEPDRKRRHFSSISSPTAAMAKKQPLSHLSEGKKLDTAVLQHQNQKLQQKLEAQKVEHSALENKFSLLKEKQQPYNSTLKTVNKSWEVLVTDLETCSNHTREWINGEDVKHVPITKDWSSSSLEDAFLCRLMETGATESSSASNCPDQMEVDRETSFEKNNSILHNIAVTINGLWYLKDGLRAAVLKQLTEDDACRQTVSNELEAELKNLRLGLSDLHLKHKSLARELQNHRDSDAKNKAELKHLKGELETTVAELNDSNCKLATLKAERNATKGAFFPVLNMGSKHAAGDKVKDKQKDLQEMESTVKELLDQASSRLVELKDLHEERLRILQKLSNLQRSLKSVKVISLSRACLLLRDQLEKSKSMVLHYRALFEKLQVEKDTLVWKERELNMKNDLVDVCRRSTAVVDSRIADLGKEIQKQINERNMIETNLEEASRDPGRKDIIAEFKALVSSFPEEMCSMQSQLSNFKEASSDIHSLRADVQSLSAVLDMKAKQCESLSFRSSSQITEINKLQSVVCFILHFLEILGLVNDFRAFLFCLYNLEETLAMFVDYALRTTTKCFENPNQQNDCCGVQDLKDNKLELKLILDMYQRESTCSRDVLEARDLEYKAWAQVQSFKSSLDEQNLELRVKTANEAEAISQQKLAAAEAEIADLRQKLEASKMDLSRLSDVLKSKNEGNEAYLSEIETIGQAYGDMQTQNQHLLQQITERDDYNIKSNVDPAFLDYLGMETCFALLLVLEGVRARQHRDSLLMDKQSMEKEIQQANISLDFFDVKAARIEDQLKNCSDQVHKLAEDKFQRSFVLENTQKKLLDLRRSSNQTRESLEDYQSRVERSRATLLEVKIDLEKERFDKRRMEEELEVARRKVSHLQEHTEGSLIVEKLQQELREYREIVKCSICHDRPKEVICNPCSVICGI